MASFADENIWNSDVILVGNDSRKNRTRNDKIGVVRRFVKLFGSRPQCIALLSIDIWIIISKSHVKQSSAEVAELVDA
jgi:hypothetical protein